MSSITSILLCFVCSGVASAQLFSAGIKGGIPLTDPFADVTLPGFFTPGQTVHSYSSSKKFVAGGMIEFHLPFGLSVEADGLYHPSRLTVVTTNAGSPATGKLSTNYINWEIPVVAKYRFLHTPLIKPYVEAGVNIRVLEEPLDGYMSSKGVAAGGGVEFKLSHLRVSPEIRYTYWGGDSSSAFPARSNRNQAELLLGVSF